MTVVDNNEIEIEMSGDVEKGASYTPGSAAPAEGPTDDADDVTKNHREEGVSALQANNSKRSSFFGRGSKRLTKNLYWSEVNMTLKSKKTGEVEKQILADVWGEAKAGETTAIMGASGAGEC